MQNWSTLLPICIIYFLLINTSTGGGENKIFDQKVKVEAKSKVGSTDNMKHKAGGGNVKVGPTTNTVQRPAWLKWAATPPTAPFKSLKTNCG